MVSLSALSVAGIVVAVFVGFNIGGSSTGVAFGPAVGSRLVRKATAAALFLGFAFLGAWTVGRNVIATMSSSIVPAMQFTPLTSVVVLFFTGLSLFISNLYGVPASTSMTAVGAIVGLGLASDTLNRALMFVIVSAWIVAPLLSFTVGVVVGRYAYPYLDRYVAFTKFDLHLVQLDRSGRVPRPRFNQNASPRDVAGSLSVVVIGCYMAFSAGASNAANAVAPSSAPTARSRSTRESSSPSSPSGSAGSPSPGARWRRSATTSRSCQSWPRSSSPSSEARSSRCSRSSASPRVWR